MKKLIFYFFAIISIESIAQSTLIQPGVVTPLMTTAQRTAIASPVNGMLIFDTNTQSYWFRQSGAWVELPKGGSTSNYWSLTGAVGNEISNTNSGGFWSANASIVTTVSSAVAPPVSGAGTRLMWIPGMSAFRAGTVNSTQWNSGSIGKWSTAFGQNTTASGNNSFASGESASAVHNNSMAIGTNVSTTAANQLAGRFSGGVLFYSGTGGYGVILNPNSNGWSSLSDSTKKENFIAAKGEDILKAVSQMRVGTWNYKGQNPKLYRHWGVMAQDFHKHFGKDKIGSLGNETTINSPDFDGVVFAAVKALEERTRKTNDDVAIIRKEMEKLEEIIEELQDDNKELRNELKKLSNP
jgi:hypothetical protein